MSTRPDPNLAEDALLGPGPEILTNDCTRRKGGPIRLVYEVDNEIIEPWRKTHDWKSQRSLMDCDPKSTAG